MNKIFTSCILIIVISYQCCLGQDSKTWIKCDSKRDVNIWYNYDEITNIIKVRIEANSTKSPKDLYARILNVEAYPNYVVQCKHAKIIKTASSNSMIYYTVTYPPFPLKKRDAVISLNHSLSNGTAKFVAECVPNYIAEKEEYERVKHYKAAWLIQPRKTGSEIKFSVEFCISGLNSHWTKEQFVQNGPVKTFCNFIDD